MHFVFIIAATCAFTQIDRCTYMAESVQLVVPMLSATPPSSCYIHLHKIGIPFPKVFS